MFISKQAVICLCYHGSPQELKYLFIVSKLQKLELKTVIKIFLQVIIQAAAAALWAVYFGLVCAHTDVCVCLRASPEDWQQ